jgi:hypothetical protein
MFLASACSFMLATILEGTYLAGAGIVIHTRLVEYGNRPLSETMLLEGHQVSKINIIVAWTSYSVVSIDKCKHDLSLIQL